jgi:hypothetical protein
LYNYPTYLIRIFVHLKWRIMLKQQFRLLSVLCFTASFASAQFATEHSTTTAFQKVFSIGNVSMPASITRTSDEGFVLSGSHSGNNFGNTDGLLLKLNKQGKPEWAKGFNQEANDCMLYGNASLCDGSIVALTDEYDGKGGLLRVSKRGQPTWQKKYAVTDGFMSLTLIKPLSDGNFVAAGPLTDNTFNGSNILIKYNPQGGVIWKKVYNMPGIRSAPVSMEIRGDAILLAGIIPAAVFNTADTMFLLKANGCNGEIISSKKLWLNDHAVFNLNMVNRSDNQIAILATLGNNNTGETINCLTRLNGNLGVLQCFRLNNVPDGSFVAATATADNGVVAVYNDVSFEKGYLIKFNKMMQPVFAKYYPKEYQGSSAYSFNTITNTSTGGFLAAGQRSFADSTVIYAVKTDKNGYAGTCGSASVTAAVSPLLIGQASFQWPDIYVPDLQIEDAVVPAANAVVKDKDLCRENYHNIVAAMAAVNEIAVEPGGFRVTAYPNPSANGFTISASSLLAENVTVIIRDVQGRLIETRRFGTNQTITAGNNWKPGIYHADCILRGERKLLRLVKL